MPNAFLIRATGQQRSVAIMPPLSRPVCADAVDRVTKLAERSGILSNQVLSAAEIVSIASRYWRLVISATSARRLTIVRRVDHSGEEIRRYVRGVHGIGICLDHGLPAQQPPLLRSHGVRIMRKA